MGVGELMARVVSGIDKPPRDVEFEVFVLAAVVAWGAAVTVFRFTKAATKTTTKANRAISFQRIVIKALIPLSLRV